MNIIITGASGFIGLHLINEFHNDNIVAIGRKFAYKDKNIKYFECDLSHAKPLIQYGNYDVLIHAAGQAHIQQNHETYDLFIKNNVDSTRNILELAVNCGVKKFVYISTIAVLNENPNDIYAISKKQAEEMVIDVCSKNGIQYSILRSVVVYGENDVKGNVNKLIKQIKRGFFPLVNMGKTIKNMIYVKNLTFMVRQVINQKENIVMNARDDDDLSVKELCQMVKKESGSNAFLIPVPNLALKAIMTGINLIKSIGLLRSINTESIKKLAQNVIVERDDKIKLPYTTNEGIKSTINYTVVPVASTQVVPVLSHTGFPRVVSK